jgi:hypothetical protein
MPKHQIPKNKTEPTLQISLTAAGVHERECNHKNKLNNGEREKQRR